MASWKNDVDRAISAFLGAAELARVLNSQHDIELKCLPAPHDTPNRIPEGKAAVFGFWWNDECLLVSRAGENSHARYTSHHYGPNRAPSTLARKLIEDPEFQNVPGIDRDSVGDWIKDHTCRVNVLYPANNGTEFGEQLKAHLVNEFNPRY